MGSEETSEIEVIPDKTGDVEVVQEESLHCCIGDCESKHEPSVFGVISFHKVPKEPYGTRQAWINVIRRSRDEPEWIPDDNAAVCSKHFRSDDLVKIPGTKRVVLDLETCPNIVPCLRLGLKINPPAEAETNEDDEVNVVAADPGFTFLPLKIKQEPRSEEEDNNDTNDKSEHFMEDDEEITPSTRPKKVKRTPKPTWSLKELSDDEGARDGYGSDSSEYEPTSSSDSDSDKEKSSSSTSKRARLSFSGQSFQKPNGSINRTPTSSSSGSNKALNFSNLRLKPNHGQPSFQLPGAPLPGSIPEKFVPSILNMIGWVEEMGNVNRSSPSEDQYYSGCMSRLEKCMQIIKTFPPIDFKTQLEKYLRVLTGVVKQRHAEGQSLANKVHFSLVSKKVLEVLRDSIEKGVSGGSSSSSATTPKTFSPVIQGVRSIAPRRLVPGLTPATSAASPQSMPAVRSQAPKLVRLPSKSIAGIAQSVVSSSAVGKPAGKTAEPELVTLDDDEDFAPKIQSVQTLANSSATTSTGTNDGKERRPSLVARSFYQFFQSVLSSKVPPPVPDDQAELIPWMGMHTEDIIEEDGTILTTDIYATIPTYPRGKYPPNVLLTPKTQPTVVHKPVSAVVTQNGVVRAIVRSSAATSASQQIQLLTSTAGTASNGVKAVIVPTKTVSSLGSVQPAILNHGRPILPKFSSVIPQVGMTASAATVPVVQPAVPVIKSAVTVPIVQPAVTAPIVQPAVAVPVIKSAVTVPVIQPAVTVPVQRAGPSKSSKPVEEVIILSDSDDDAPPASVRKNSNPLVSDDDSILGI